LDHAGTVILRPDFGRRTSGNCLGLIALSWLFPQMRIVLKNHTGGA
jgi:hypothetical protein